MNPISKYLIATTAGALLATGAHSETFDVSAEVVSTVALTETTPLNFGSLYIRRGTAGVASTLTLGANGTFTGTGQGTVGPTGSRIVSLGGQTAAELTISGASPFTTLTIDTTTTGPTPLVHSSGNGTLPTIIVGALVTDAVGGQITLDGNGDGTIRVGAPITTAAVGTPAYSEGTYTGEYTVSVSY